MIGTRTDGKSLNQSTIRTEIEGDMLYASAVLVCTGPFAGELRR